MTLVIGRTSMRTVLLTSLLPISVVLVVLARAGDVATLEYSVEPLPASREQRPRPDTETTMGTSLKDLDEFQQQYRIAVLQMSELIIYRGTRQWLQFDWIFSLTSKGREQAKILKILHGFTERIIAERKLYHEQTNGQYLKNIDSDISVEEDDVKSIGTQRKQLAMLDLLISAHREGVITDLEIRQEVDTVMFAGHDTVASSLSFILALLAEHKDIQDRVRNEVDIVMQENENKLTMKFLHQLSYLERCFALA